MNINIDMYIDIKQLNEQIESILELYPENAGEEITDFADYEDALNKIYQKYKNNEALTYCPNAKTIDYDGQKYSLAVVLGVPRPTKGGMKPHGMSHFMDKHTYTHENGTIPTEQDLIDACKDVQEVLNDAVKQNKTKKQHQRTSDVVYNPFEHKIIFGNQEYIYIICLAKDKRELNYLHNLFKRDNPNYIKDQRTQIRRKQRNELPPKYNI